MIWVLVIVFGALPPNTPPGLVKGELFYGSEQQCKFALPHYEQMSPVSIKCEERAK